MKRMSFFRQLSLDLLGNYLNEIISKFHHFYYNKLTCPTPHFFQIHVLLHKWSYRIIIQKSYNCSGYMEGQNE